MKKNVYARNRLPGCNYICMHLIILDTSICLQENDIYWNVLWPLATRGKVVKQKCPGGAESLGIDYVCLLPTYISM